MAWRFGRAIPDVPNFDPVEHEFFTTEALETIADALVREAIQNSLDAKAGDETNQPAVRVAITCGTVARQRVAPYFEGLWPHARALPPTFPKLVAELADKDPVEFLVIEDFGTRGLEGDPKQWTDTPQNNVRNDFYYFWRNVGRSGKVGEDRGRWGLGKTVFAYASQACTYFGLTVRQSDRRRLLMGRAVFCMHTCNGTFYRPYGFYGRDRDDSLMPIEDRHAIDDFADAFQLRRRDEPGLSVVVPFPEEEVKWKDLLSATWRHYFWPILEGHLEVEIHTPTDKVRLHRDTWKKTLQQDRALETLRPIVTLAERWMETRQPTAVLEAPEPDVRPQWPSHPLPESERARLQALLDRGEALALQQPLFVHAQRPDGSYEPRHTFFHVLLQRKPENEPGDGHFIRQGISVENPTIRRPRGLRWIVVAEDPTLCAFLGDAENPAHTEWQRASPKLKSKYRFGPTTLDFIRKAPEHIARWLAGPTQQRDPKLLQHVFSIPTRSPTTTAPTPTAVRPAAAALYVGTTEETVANIAGHGSEVRLVREDKGFRLQGTWNGNGARRLAIEMAYDVLRGNPFVRYSPFDFEVGKTAKPHCTGARIVEAAYNRLVVELEQPKFEVRVTGFDPHRDLRVKVQVLEGSSDSAA